MTTPDDRAVVLFSGGLDSSTCLAWARGQFGADNIHLLSMNYGQKHAVELEQARIVAARLCPEATMTVVRDTTLSQLTWSTLTGAETNAYAREHGLPDTFVPGRNLLLLTLAAAHGAMVGARNIVTGVCEADAAGYPDTRAPFVEAAGVACSRALDEKLTIHAPLLALDKSRTWALAHKLGVLDDIIEHTHTCYEGDRSVRWSWGYGCGRCAACHERAQGYLTFMERLDS